MLQIHFGSENCLSITPFNLYLILLFYFKLLLHISFSFLVKGKLFKKAVILLQL